MKNHPHRKLILAAIAKHDGHWGWNQLERALSPIHPEVGSTLRSTLATLEKDGFIKPIPTPGRPGSPRFSITVKGTQEIDRD